MPGIDLGSDIAMGDAIDVLLDLDVIVDPDPPDDELVVETAAELGDGGVQFGQAVEFRMPKPSEQPAFGDQHAHFDLGFVARFVGPGRQDRGAVVRSHVGVGPVNHRVVETRLDDRDLGVVRHE